jgi:hypothetical protein
MNDIIGDRILLGGWVIYPDGEKLMAISPAGVTTQIELIDVKKILGPQPKTPPDYVSPTLTDTSQGFNTTTPVTSAK